MQIRLCEKAYEQGMVGCIDEVAVFGRVLSQAEIQQLVKRANEGKPLGT